MEITRTSQLTGKRHTLNINCTEDQYFAWANNGVHIQVAMPKVPAPEREFIITGITPSEWEELFGPNPHDSK